MGARRARADEPRIDIPEDMFEGAAPRVSPETLAFMRRRLDAEGELVPKKRREGVVAAAAHDRTKVETERMMWERDWRGCEARHLVALYDLMHARTYGVAAPMTAAERYRLVGRAAGFLRNSFGGDVAEVIEYFRWAWGREVGRERWAREKGIEGRGRIGPGLMFSTHLLGDYRVDKARRS